LKCWKLITTRRYRPIIELDISYIGQKYLTPCTLWRGKKGGVEGRETGRGEKQERAGGGGVGEGREMEDGKHRKID